MRIDVDALVCETNGICEVLAPHIFRVTDEDVVEIASAEVDPSDLPAIEEAVRRCPKQALTLSE